MQLKTNQDIINYVCSKNLIINTIKKMQETINNGYPYDTLPLKDKTIEILKVLQNHLIPAYNEAIKNKK